MRPTTISRRGITTGTSTRILRMKHNYRRAVLGMGPVGYWRLGEAAGTVAVDQCGLNNGTYVGAPTLGVTGLLAGDPNTAVSFASASSQYISLPTTTGFPTGAAPRSIGFVVNENTAANQGIILYGTAAATQLISLYIDTSGALASYSGSGGTTITGPILKTGTNKHVIAVYNGTAWQAYVNGLVGGNLTNQTLNTVVGGIAARIASDGGAAYLNGTLDEPAIWDRALSADEIFRLWRIGAI